MCRRINSAQRIAKETALKSEELACMNKNQHAWRMFVLSFKSLTFLLKDSDTTISTKDTPIKSTQLFLDELWPAFQAITEFPPSAKESRHIFCFIIS